MKLVTYLDGKQEKLAILAGGYVYNMDDLHPGLPHHIKEFLENWEDFLPITQHGLLMISEGMGAATKGIPIEKVTLLSPVPHPTSCRDGYAFRQHVATARRNRGVPMIPEFDQYPVLYFTNHQSIKGPGEIPCMPDHFEKLDFELEVAVVICKEGINISAEEADGYIGGLMVMNDFSARTLQMEEMKLNLGPCKGKDFATALGPWLVTPDELKGFEIPAKEGHTGKNWDLRMTAKINNQEVSRGSLGDMDWTFAELIERASYGAAVFPGDVIGSGTVGTGCFMELNGTGRLQDRNYKDQWLQEGDRVELEVQGLGRLHNTIVKTPTDWSILKKKKL